MPNRKKLAYLHVHVSGPDYPGILSELIERIAPFEWSVVDIKQFVFNGVLNLSMFLEGPTDKELPTLRRMLEDYQKESGIHVETLALGAKSRLGTPYKFRSVVTLVGGRIDTPAFLELTRTLAQLDLNILRTEQLDSGPQHVLELLVGARERLSGVNVLDHLVRFKENHAVDIAVQDDTLFRRNKRLIVLDADMTFLQCEIIDELGRMAGVEDEMKSITEKAMNGQLNFKRALRSRVKLLKGLPVKHLEALKKKLPLTPGAKELVSSLQHLGFKIAIVSGGFQFFIDGLVQEYGLDYGFANNLKIENRTLTGEVEGEIIDARGKGKILKSLAEREGLSLKQVVAVGDGANDIHMLAKAGLGIAFNAKPIVQKHARASINVSNLELILYFLGIDGHDLKELRTMAKRSRKK